MDIHKLINEIKKIIIYIISSYLGKKDDRNRLYKIEETYRNAEGKQIVVGKIIGTPRGHFNIPASRLVTTRKDLLAGFDLNDVLSIVGLASSEKDPYVVEVRNTPYKYYTLIAMLFGVILVISNILSSKLIFFLGYTMTGGQIIFPLSYALGDVLTEVYGYKRSRQLIWGSIVCNIAFVFFSQVAIVMTPSPYWHHQHAFSETLGAVPRIIAGSLIGYFCGEFINSYILAKMKIVYRGQYLWKRVLGSSTIAIAVASVVFAGLSFIGKIPITEVLSLMIKIYLACISYEILSLPLTYMLIQFLKKKEQIDIYDFNTNFNPFSLDVTYAETDNYFELKKTNATT